MKNEKEIEKGKKVVGEALIDEKYKTDSVEQARDLIESPFDLPLISEFMEGCDLRETVLTNWEIRNAEFGDFAVMEFNGEYSCRSGGTAIVDQIQHFIKMGRKDPIFVTIEKCSTDKGDYFSLLGRAV